MTVDHSRRLSPWRDIWVHPRSTLRAVAAEGPNHRALIVSAGWGVVQSMVQGAQNNMGLRAPLLLIVLTAIVIGSVWGLLQVSLLSGLVYLVGRWTGLSATYYGVRTALAWGTIPAGASLPLWLGAAVLFGRRLFLSDQALAGSGQPLILLGIGLLYLVTGCLWLWSVVVVTVGLAEVQGVSVPRAIGLIIGSAAVFAVTVMLVVGFVIVAL